MSIQFTEKVMTALAKYQWCFGVDDICRIYPRTETHMTQKWMACGRNLLKFWSCLDSDSQEMLLEDFQYQHFYLKDK